MNGHPILPELILLVPDLDLEVGLDALLKRHEHLGFREITYRIFRHPQRDPGVRSRCHDFLRAFSRGNSKALVVLDYEGSGAQVPVVELENDMEARMRQNGWGADRARAVAIDPEVEIWVWARSPAVKGVLGWGRGDLFGWLEEKGYWPANQPKPPDPKTAFRESLRQVGKKPSASVFRAAAEQIDPAGCQDRAFVRLWSVLQAWFPT